MSRWGRELLYGSILLAAGAFALVVTIAFALRDRDGGPYRGAERAFRYQLALLDSGNYDAVWQLTLPECRPDLDEARMSMRLASSFVRREGGSWSDAFPVRDVFLTGDGKQAIITLDTRIPGPAFAYLEDRGGWKIGCLTGGADGAGADQ